MSVLDLPVVKNVIDSTYGIILYQEQVIQLVKDFAGFTEAEADDTRRAMGKKEAKVMASTKVRFSEGAKSNGYKEYEINELWSILEKYAEYSFNKCLPDNFPLQILDNKESSPRFTTLEKLRDLWTVNKSVGLVGPSNEYMEIDSIDLIGNEGILEITLDDGSVFSATPQHKFLAQTETGEEKLCLSEIVRRDLAFVCKE